jgi:hypothetical protein
LEFSGARSRNSRCARNEPLPRDNKTQITFARKLQIRRNQFCWKANNKENNTKSCRPATHLLLLLLKVPLLRILHCNGYTRSPDQHTWSSLVRGQETPAARPLHLSTCCSESDHHPDVHALLNKIVQPALRYGRHCRLLVSRFQCSGMMERLRGKRKDYAGC